MDVIHGRCCVYAMEYHIVWCVKYRRKVLFGQVETDLHTPAEECKRRNALRDRKVPEYVIDRMKAMYVPPTVGEGFSLVMHTSQIPDLPDAIREEIAKAKN